ncbi:hypothetical protein [Bacillus thermotolerans]|uniref:Uncharacterized protein n=1 Tax=Bacillus thermotolerans TaxID=1221996 RepID=A0A0F5I6T0_BACTR|nr:hypothetical protein [Bacillus thermotolerans]KKB41344.1 hypothetical protein QY95_00824 [Bacillus thermotolerans]
MNKGEEQKEFLQQLQWAKDQDRILAEIEAKLYEMRAIAEYAANHELTADEVELLNDQLRELKGEIDSLEQRLHSVVH